MRCVQISEVPPPIATSPQASIGAATSDLTQPTIAAPVSRGPGFTVSKSLTSTMVEEAGWSHGYLDPDPRRSLSNPHGLTVPRIDHPRLSVAPAGRQCAVLQPRHRCRVRRDRCPRRRHRPIPVASGRGGPQPGPDRRPLRPPAACAVSRTGGDQRARTRRCSGRGLQACRRQRRGSASHTGPFAGKHVLLRDWRRRREVPVHRRHDVSHR